MIVPDFIERSNRKTLYLSVMKDGVVCIKAPIHMKDETIERFVQEKQDWIRSKLSIIHATRDKFSEIINYNKFLIYGNSYSLAYSDIKKIKTSDNFEILIPKKIDNSKIKRSELSFTNMEKEDTTNV